MKLNEHMVELQDSRVNFMGLSEPKTFSFMNFESSQDILPDNYFNHFTIMINLSHKVIIQKRVVYDVFMMFGDVGGLRDFLGLFLASIFSFFSEEFLKASIVQRLFHVSGGGKRDSRGLQIEPKATLAQLKGLHFSNAFVLCNSNKLSKCFAHQRRRKALE